MKELKVSTNYFLSKRFRSKIILVLLCIAGIFTGLLFAGEIDFSFFMFCVKLVAGSIIGLDFISYFIFSPKVYILSFDKQQSTLSVMKDGLTPPKIISLPEIQSVFLRNSRFSGYQQSEILCLKLTGNKKFLGMSVENVFEVCDLYTFSRQERSNILDFFKLHLRIDFRKS